MDAGYLDGEKRQQFHAALVRRRLMLDKLVQRMEAAGWYTNDPVYQCMLAARASLHAAINHVGQLPETVKTFKKSDAAWSGYPAPISK